MTWPKSLRALHKDVNAENTGSNYLKQFPRYCGLKFDIFHKKFQAASLKGKATLKENIIKMKDILFPNILVHVS